MVAEALPVPRPPHPVSFDIEYPERVSRLTTFFRLILVIPQLIVIYLLLLAFYFVSIIAWFGILFTGRYPKALFEFGAGVMRWNANVFAYLALLRDEYPPFSWEPGEYHLTLGIEHAERQSRWRLLVRFFSIWPNYVVFGFVQIAWLFTTVVAWFAILFTGAYPRGLFNFAVGVIRWYQRQFAYIFLLRDEYPPYSLSKDARPGNEVVSAILGVPLLALYIGLQFLPFAGVLGRETDTVDVLGPITAIDAFYFEQPSGEANNVRLTILGYIDNAPAPPRSTVFANNRFVSFRVRAEKDGFLPTFFTPFLARLHDCNGFGYSPDAVSDGFEFHMFWRGGERTGTIVFQIPTGAQPCDLIYHSGLGQITFRFAADPCASGVPGALPRCRRYTRSLR